jgi:hypothetical protein
MSDTKTCQQDPLVPMRLALIALAALIVGTLVGTLTYFAIEGNVAQAVLAGFVALGAAVLPLDKMIGR